MSSLSCHYNLDRSQATVCSYYIDARSHVAYIEMRAAAGT